MTTNDLVTVRDKAEKAYEAINDIITSYGFEMLDLAYPKKDGEQDADVISEMMLLRQSSNRLSKACNILSGKLTDVIEDEEELK